MATELKVVDIEKCSACRAAYDPEAGDRGGRLVFQGGYYLCGACVAAMDKWVPGIMGRHPGISRLPE